MLYALVNGEMAEARHGRVGLCPMCGDALISKCGDIVYPYWSHTKNGDCDPWSEPESAWHRTWKGLFPQERCEVTMGPHRADAIDGFGHVVEFQHSSIPLYQVQERIAFYGSMKWVVDARNSMSDFEVAPCLRMEGVLQQAKPRAPTPVVPSAQSTSATFNRLVVPNERRWVVSPSLLTSKNHLCRECWRGFSNMSKYVNGELKEAPGVCPFCGVQLVTRTNRRTQKAFFGCPSFPRCRFTTPYKTKRAQAPVERVYRFAEIPYRWKHPKKWVVHALSTHSTQVYLDFGNWVVSLLPRGYCEVIPVLDFINNDLGLDVDFWYTTEDHDSEPGLCGWSYQSFLDSLGPSPEGIKNLQVFARTFRPSDHLCAADAGFSEQGPMPCPG